MMTDFVLKCSLDQVTDCLLTPKMHGNQLWPFPISNFTSLIDCSMRRLSSIGLEIVFRKKLMAIIFLPLCSQVLERDHIMSKFYGVTENLEQALSRISCEKLDIADEVKEQVEYKSFRTELAVK